MKKLFFLLTAFAIVLSCSSDETSTPVTPPPAPIAKYTITLSAGEGGTVSTTGGEYESGQTVNVTATPQGEYVFTSWSDGNTNPTRTITVSSNNTLAANFEKRKYPLTINIEGEGEVLEEIVNAGRTTDYDSGTIVKLTAIPTGEWYLLDSWGENIDLSANSIQLNINEPLTLNVKFVESNLIVNENITRIDIPGQSTEYLRASFYNVSGPFHFKSDDENYMFYPGTVFWGENKPNSKDEIESSPSHSLKRVNGKWEYFKTYEDVKFWGARNFEILENHIVVGDGNEIGQEGTDWDGDTYYGEILTQGEIKWTKVNDNNNRGFYHGSTIGDLNGDGYMDIGGAPGQWFEDQQEWRLKIFIQNANGTFTNNDAILDFGDIHNLPFTLDFANVFGDSKDEIITADYGGGDPFTNPELNQIKIFSFDEDDNKYKLHWKSSSSTAFYDIGMGATSIKVYDFDNDGIQDISVAREDQQGNSFEIWKGNGDGTFVPHFSTPIWNENELQFREFLLMDVNNDNSMDIVLRPFHYGSLYRNNPVWWNVYQNNGIKLNSLIWLNNQDGTFSNYDTEELKIEGMLVDNVHPYMENGILHFTGTFTTEEGNLYGQDAIDLTTYDIKVNIK